MTEIELKTLKKNKSEIGKKKENSLFTFYSY